MRIVRFFGISILGLASGVLFQYFFGWGGIGAGVGVASGAYEFWTEK
jgi:hypothetical protein